MKFSLLWCQKDNKRRNENDINAYPLSPDKIISSFLASFNFEMIPIGLGPNITITVTRAR